MKKTYAVLALIAIAILVAYALLPDRSFKENLLPVPEGVTLDGYDDRSDGGASEASLSVNGGEAEFSCMLGADSVKFAWCGLLWNLDPQGEKNYRNWTFVEFVVVYLYYAIIGHAPTPNWYLLLFPLLVVMLAGLALGFGIIISSMTTKYRDLQILFSFFVQLWMYGTPIVYPLSQVAGKQVLGLDLTTIMCLNPVTSVIEAFKYGALGAGQFVGWGWLAYSFVFMLVVLAIGILIFNKVQKSFMDTV